jgi:hypothetical protein
MKTLPMIIATLLMATPTAAEMVTNDVWQTVSRVKCADASDWSSHVWEIVGEVDDRIVDHVCKTRLGYVECMNNPSMTVGQALASIHYKIEFGRKLPEFRCGA